MDDQHFRKLERAYITARCNEYYQPKLTISTGAAVLAIRIEPKMHHAAGAAHGSVCFKLLDDAAFFAANSLEEDVFVLTVSFHVHFFRPVVDGILESRGRLTHRTGRLFFAEASVFAEDGNVVASGSGTFMRSNIALNEEIGYR